jgi:hypothetical protein
MGDQHTGQPVQEHNNEAAHDNRDEIRPPTMARLITAPKEMVMMLSNGERTPKERRPEIRISVSATINITAPRQLICKALRSLPSPKILISNSMA